MELSFREWMIIIGVLLIVAVLLDGYRRVRNDRRNRIRVSLSRHAFSRSSSTPADNADDVNPELPNGGARVRIKRPPPDLQLDEPVPVLMESVRMGEPEPFESEPPQPEPQAEPEPVPADEYVAADEYYVADAEQDDEVPAAAAVSDEQDDDWHAAGAEDAGDVASDEEFFGEPARSVAREPESQSPNFADAQEVLVIHVVARDAEGFRGHDLLQILLACDLRFGRMNIFHRYEYANGRGPVQFSLANLVEPGSFDLDTMEDMRTPGVSLFLTLPGPEKPITAFNYMVETAQVLVRNLHGELRDEAHSVMTPQTIEHCRQRIRDFERRQLTLQI